MVLRNLRRRPLATGLTSVSVALGVALFAAVGALRHAAEHGFQRSAGICDQVVGAKGSPLQLVLSSIYYLGASPGNVSWDLWRELRTWKGVRWAVPVAIGDTHRGYRVVGVSDEFFSRVRLPNGGEGDPLRLAEGRVFDYPPERFEALAAELDAGGDAHLEDHPEVLRAVVGAEAAAGAGLRVGARFAPAHGLEGGAAAERHAEAEVEVVGVLEPTGTPIDRAVFVPVGLYHLLAGHRPTAETATGGARDPRGLSAIYLRTVPGMYQIRIWRRLNDRLDAQSARPVDEVRKLFRLVGGLDLALRAISALVVVVAVAGVVATLTNTMAARRREFAVLRALGARRRTLLGLVTAESAAIAFLGGVLGLVLAGVLAAVASEYVRRNTGVALSVLPRPADLALVGAVTLAGALAGLLPAVRAYRTEPARVLASQL